MTISKISSPDNPPGASFAEAATALMAFIAEHAHRWPPLTRQGLDRLRDLATGVTLAADREGVTLDRLPPPAPYSGVVSYGGAKVGVQPAQGRDEQGGGHLDSFVIWSPEPGWTQGMHELIALARSKAEAEPPAGVARQDKAPSLQDAFLAMLRRQGPVHRDEVMRALWPKFKREIALSRLKNLIRDVKPRLELESPCLAIRRPRKGHLKDHVVLIDTRTNLPAGTRDEAGSA
jgi:hypothetical protein